MFISDVLHTKGHRVVKVRTTDTVQEAVNEMVAQRIGAVMVENEWMRHVGIFSERDFMNAVAEHGSRALALPVETIMSSTLVTCQPSDRIDTALEAMTMAKIRHLPVMEGGRLVGIVSIGDLVKHRLDEKALEANVLLDIARLHA